MSIFTSRQALCFQSSLLAAWQAKGCTQNTLIPFVQVAMGYRRHGLGLSACSLLPANVPALGHTGFTSVVLSWRRNPRLEVLFCHRGKSLLLRIGDGHDSSIVLSQGRLIDSCKV